MLLIALLAMRTRVQIPTLMHKTVTDAWLLILPLGISDSWTLEAQWPGQLNNN